MKNILCADIGGTNSRFAHFIFENGMLSFQKQYLCLSKDINSAEELLQAVELTDFSIDNADSICIGVAGPVEEDGLRAKLSNAPLFMDFRQSLEKYKRKQGKDFFLVNDFSLQAFASLAFFNKTGIVDSQAIQLVSPIIGTQADLSEIAEQTYAKTRGILGAGTGLGAAMLLAFENNTAHTWKALPSEGGHCDMPFYGKEERDFADFALAHLKKDRLSAEDVLAGRALSLLHLYVHNEEVLPEIAAQNLLVDGVESLQLRLYARFLGRFCRGLASTSLCFGGLYLGGGVLSKNPYIVKSEHFLEEYYHPSSILLKKLKDIPLFHIFHKDAGLYGAAQLCVNALS